MRARSVFIPALVIILFFGAVIFGLAGEAPVSAGAKVCPAIIETEIFPAWAIKPDASTLKPINNPRVSNLKASTANQ